MRVGTRGLGNRGRRGTSHVPVREIFVSFQGSALERINALRLCLNTTSDKDSRQSLESICPFQGRALDREKKSA